MKYHNAQYSQFTKAYVVAMSIQGLLQIRYRLAQLFLYRKFATQNPCMQIFCAKYSCINNLVILYTNI